MTPLVIALYKAQGDLIADVGEPAVVLSARCDQVDQALALLERFMMRNPCPDPDLLRSAEALLGACAGLWSIMGAVARRAPEGIDAAVNEWPGWFTDHMDQRVSSLDRAWSHARRLSLA